MPGVLQESIKNQIQAIIKKEKGNIMSDENGMIYVGGLWKGETKSGDKMLSGKVGMVKIVILPNKKKERGDKRPDVNIFITQAEKKEGSSSGGGSDDIPF